jgi:hypothetical protein
VSDHAAPADRPIFVHGTGRCGSTFVQSTLCRCDDVWIWGEHDGMLTPLLNWSRTARTGVGLAQFGYPNVGRPPSELLDGNETLIAWMTPFTRDEIEAAEVELLRGLFTRRLPEGKARWGFKEIRYGVSSHTPARLIELFPEGRSIHVVRHPMATIGSSIRAWNPDLFQPAEDDAGQKARFDKLEKVVETQIGRWLAATRHFLDLETRHPGHLRTIRIESAVEDLCALSDFLGIAPDTLRAASAAGARHPADRFEQDRFAPARARLRELLDHGWDRVADLAGTLGYAREDGSGPPE